MKWSVQELNKFKGEQVSFSEIIDVNDSLVTRSNEIIAVKPVKVEGFINISEKEYILHFNLSTVVTLPSSRSLKPVDVDFNFNVDEVYMTETQFDNKDDQLLDDMILVLSDNTINLDEAVEDHILLNIPLQVLASDELEDDELPKGNDWEVISQDEYEKRLKESKQQTNIDPRLAKLSELMVDDDE